jgi:hypothetical protein
LSGAILLQSLGTGRLTPSEAVDSAGGDPNSGALTVRGSSAGPMSSRALFATRLSRHPLTESDAGAITILIDKHDAGFFKCPLQRFNGALFQIFPSLKSSDRINRHLGRGS